MRNSHRLRGAHRQRWVALALLTCALATGCTDDDPPEKKAPTDDPEAAAAIAGLTESERWSLTGLQAPAHVVRTAGNVPHIYAENRADLARVMGFVAARDRFFLIDMLRRLGLGRISEVFGSVALGADAESRGSGMTAVADRLLAQLTPEMTEILDGYAAGVNDYVAAVKAEKLPPPSELSMAAGLLGYKSPSDAMAPFDRRSMCGVLAVVLFQQGYETDDIRRATQRRGFAAATAGKPDAAQREAALLSDVLDNVAPLFPETTTPGYGENGAGAPPPPPQSLAARRRAKAQAWRAALHALPVPAAMLERLHGRAERLAARLGKSHRGSFGSNIWAVAGSASADGAAILASDGHLQLSVPSLFWRIGLDTRVFGGGDTHQLGLTFAGLPLLGAGTNGAIAWSNTYLYGDITDFYRETVKLGADGAPVSIVHEGADKALVAVDESFDTAKITLLQSPGGTVTRRRYETWDGRRLVAIEGRPATEAELADPAKLPAGKAMVDVLGDMMVPGDEDQDGTIVAVSMDLTTLDVADTPGAIDAIGHADDVDGFLTATRRFVGWAQNMMAVDAAGNAAYTSYNATPCRGYLARDEAGFAPGADPRDLIDGKTYRGFSVPNVAGVVDETPGAIDPYACVVPFAAWPTARNPTRGFVVNANNDISGTSTDGVLGNDTWYLGGAWVLGLRAHAIDEGVAASVSGGGATTASMATVQGTTRSLLGQTLVPAFVAALDKAEAASKSAKPAADPLAAVWMADPATLTIVRDRLQAWHARGCPAESGVATFYHQPTAEQRQDAIATTIFNAWLVEALHGMYDDEGTDLDALEALRHFVAAVQGRGPGNPRGLAGWLEARGESVLWDDAGTPAVETSDEILGTAALRALAALRAKPSGHGLGGYGTDDPEAWLWGLRHMVRFDSILASFLEGVDGLGALLDLFAITPELHPLADALTPKDPRANLPGFPRPGDYGAVDAAAPNAIRSAHYGPETVGQPRDMSYSHGPIMRMVVALYGPDADHPVGRIDGRTILPGGQSALLDSPYFADQVRLWLANETHPMLFSPKDVIAGAIGHEVYEPTP